METESIWLVLIEQELYHVIQKKTLGELVQDIKLCAAFQNHSITQELAKHQSGLTGSLLQQPKVTMFTSSNSTLLYFLWLCKSRMWLTCTTHTSD